MKVLLRRNIAQLGEIGEVVEVRPGYARNYLLPQGLAAVPTEGNIKAIEAEKQAYLAQLAQERAALEARAKILQGKEFTIFARANVEGHLYGSVGPAQIASAVTKEGIILEPQNILLDEPIHKLDKYEVTVAFGQDVRCGISVWVVPPREGDEDESAPGEMGDAADEDEGSSEQDQGDTAPEETP